METFLFASSSLDSAGQLVEFALFLEGELFGNACIAGNGWGRPLRFSIDDFRLVGRFLPEPILVPADVLLHAPVSFEYQRAGHDVVDERAIVADEQQRARPFDQVRLEQLERLDIEIVGRLVEHEHVGRPREQPGEQEPIPLSAGERLDRRVRALGWKQEIPQIPVHVLRLAVHRDRVVSFADRIEHRTDRDRAARAADRSTRSARSRPAARLPHPARARQSASAAASSCPIRSARSDPTRSPRMTRIDRSLTTESAAE